MTWAEISDRLSQPFPASAISWRAGSVSRDKKRAQALPYAEPRVYEDVLNEVLGPHWSCKFKVWGEQRIICDLSITVDGEVITRSSTGEFDSGDKIAQGTVAEAQAFKRACVKFGLGRYLYDLSTQWVGYDETSRKLTETPHLPDKYLPSKTPSKPQQQAARTNTQAAPAKAENTQVDAEDEPIGKKRASALHNELLGLGFDNKDINYIVDGAAGRKVKALAELTEFEARMVWNEARNAASKRAEKNKPPFDPDELKPFAPNGPGSRMLTNTEASNLHRALSSFGVKDHYAFASEVMGRKVNSLQAATVNAATRIYEKAVEKYGTDEQKAEYEARKAAA